MSENEEMRLRYHYGLGSWDGYRKFGGDLESIWKAAEGWRQALRGVERPWLVWNAHHDWCWVQQRLVEQTHWTPVVGYDPRIGPPKRLSRNALLVNFDRDLNIRFMAPHFVLEFMFLFTDKLAFWHSDLLIPIAIMKRLAAQFDALQPGETIATDQFRWARFWRMRRRAWELVGCTTAGASEHQFKVGSGWWSNIHLHVNAPDDAEEAARRLALPTHDHGSGILYWQRRYGGRLKSIPIDLVERGHFSPVSYPHLYRRVDQSQGRDLRAQMDNNALGVGKAMEIMNIDKALLLDGD